MQPPQILLSLMNVLLGSGASANVKSSKDCVAMSNTQMSFRRRVVFFQLLVKFDITALRSR